MIQRLALLIGGVGAAAVLAFALGLTNFVFAGPGAAANTAASQSFTNSTDVAAVGDGQSGASAQTPQKKTVVDKVYVAPTPAPKVIHVNPKAPSNRQTTKSQSTRPAAAPQQHRGQESEGASHRGGGRGRGDD